VSNANFYFIYPLSLSLSLSFFLRIILKLQFKVAYDECPIAVGSGGDGNVISGQTNKLRLMALTLGE
jgi:hypothetical protein